MQLLVTSVLCLAFVCQALHATSNAEILRIQREIQAGNTNQAERDLQVALQSDPRNGGLYNLRGIIEAARSQMSAAETSFLKAIDLDPHLVGAYLNFGRICEMRAAQDSSAGSGASAINRAIEAYQRLLVLEPAASEARLQLAKLLAGQGRHAASLSELDRLPRASRDSELATSLRRDNLKQLALGYEAHDQLSDARKTVEALALEEPKEVAPLLELARIAQRQADLQGALGYLAHARTLQPESASVHFFFGVVCIQLDLLVEAKKSFDKALSLEPANPAYNYARGSVELQGNSAWLAIPYFKKFVAAQPDNPRGRFALAAAEFSSHDYESSAREFRAIAGHQETEAGVQYFLGRIAKVEGDWSAAAEHLAKSVAAAPGFAESHAELGLAKMHLGDLAGAKSEMERALALRPDSYLANGNLLALYQRMKDPHLAAQQQRLRELDSKRSEKQELMVRTIRVEP